MSRGEQQRRYGDDRSGTGFGQTFEAIGDGGFGEFEETVAERPVWEPARDLACERGEFRRPACITAAMSTDQNADIGHD
jgi:hypothetical protein